MTMVTDDSFKSHSNNHSYYYHHPQQVRYFSSSMESISNNNSSIRGTVSDGVPTSHETTQRTPGCVTRTLRVLDMDVVRQILEELRSVDVNSDGR